MEKELDLNIEEQLENDSLNDDELEEVSGGGTISGPQIQKPNFNYF